MLAGLHKYSSRLQHYSHGRSVHSIRHWVRRLLLVANLPADDSCRIGMTCWSPWNPQHTRNFGGFVLNNTFGESNQFSFSFRTNSQLFARRRTWETWLRYRCIRSDRLHLSRQRRIAGNRLLRSDRQNRKLRSSDRLPHRSSTNGELCGARWLRRRSRELVDWS